MFYLVNVNEWIKKKENKTLELISQQLSRGMS